MPTINVLDAAGATVAIETPSPLGRVAAASSKPVTISTEDLAAIGATNSAAAANESANTGLNGLLKGIFASIRTWLPRAAGTRAYDYVAGQRLTTAGSGQVRSTAVTATEVLLHASVRGFIRVGDNTVSASVGPGSIPLAADEKFHMQITSGQFISFIRDGATDGSLAIVPALAQ